MSGARGMCLDHPLRLPNDFLPYLHILSIAIREEFFIDLYSFVRRETTCIECEMKEKDSHHGVTSISWYVCDGLPRFQWSLLFSPGQNILHHPFSLQLLLPHSLTSQIISLLLHFDVKVSLPLSAIPSTSSPPFSSSMSS